MTSAAIPPALIEAKNVFRMQTFRWLIVGLATGALLATAVGVATNNRVATPSDTSADAGFARDMGDHHQQAVDMAFIIRDKSQDQPIRLLAFDIINTQATQRGMMMGWLEQWNLPQTTLRPALAWMNKGQNSNMDHGLMDSSEEHSDMMPGMASETEIERLKKLTGREADILFMQLMIRHHAGGVSMAESTLELSKTDVVRHLAGTIVTSQQAEIELLTQMLKERGAGI